MRSARIIGFVGAAFVAVALVWLGVGAQTSPIHRAGVTLLFTLGFALTVGSLVSRLRAAERISARVAALAQQMREVTAGNRAQRAKLPTGDDEIARIADCFRAQLEALERERERAEVASTAKSSFLANMSHELRTPLNAIIGYAELIAEELQDREQELGEFAADIERIQLSARHLLGLITDILDISKIEAGEVKVEIRRVDIPRLVKDVRAATELLIHKRGNSFTVELAPELGLLDSDTPKLRQILINLLGNAAKFTENGHVTLAITGDDQQLRFAVTDTGIGIPEHKLELLFEPFVQADGSSSRRFGGTGLGLTISRHFAGLLGGRLTATSEPGRGSTFTLTLPRTRL
jgi:signal transduction histidine kinase